MANLQNYFEIFREIIQNYPNAPNLVIIGSGMTDIWGGMESICVCVNFLTPCGTGLIFSALEMH